MKTYEIVYSKDEKYDIIVFSLSYETPIYSLKEISEELLINNINNSTVYFDMLLCYGNNSKRFYNAEFRNGKFVNNSLKIIVAGKNHILREISANYYKDNENALVHSILNSVQIRDVKKGCAV